MNILQLCNKVPFPPKDGGCMAMNNLTQGLLNEGHKVKILAINTKKHFVEIEKLPANYRSSTNIEAVFVDTTVKPAAAFFNLFSSKSYNIIRFYSKTFEKKLIDVLKAESFDIIQLESIYVSMYVDVIRNYSKAKIVLRAHNIEYQLWELAAQQSGNPLKKAYLNLLARRLKKYELNSLNGIDAIAAITANDENCFRKAGFSKAIETFPFGIDIPKNSEAMEQQEDYLSVFHIGAMDWQPNIEGLKWFLSQVWDKVHAKHPELKLYLAGRNMPVIEWEQLNKPNVILIGEVEDAQKFMRSKGIMIAPLLSGGGMRVKIIEGLSLGKTIITTKIGAQGINCENNKHCILAADADEFTEAISKCITDYEFYKNIGENAKILAAEHYNNADICNRLTQFYQRLLL